MSRCFPFPPPGYIRNGASGDDALIDSIKLQKEREKVLIGKKKETDRDKKGNGSYNEKKEKRRYKHGDNSDGKKKRASDKCHQGNKSKVESKEKHLQKRSEDVAEQLEKSCLTEELEQLNSTNICYSSDGAQSGNKRKQDSLPSNSNQSHGSIIRIRVASGKHKEADTLIQVQASTKSGRGRANPPSDNVQLRAQNQCASASTIRSNVVKELTHTRKERVLAIEKVGLPDPELLPSTIREVSHVRNLLPSAINETKELMHARNERVLAREEVFLPDPYLLPSTSGKKESLPVESLQTSLESKSVNKKLQKKDKLYKALFKDWIPPPPLCYEPADDDEDWLFKSKDQDNRPVKRLKPSTEPSFFHDCHTYGPRAHFLPDVEIYALPYAIPF